MDPRLLADVKGAEGCKLSAYRDSLGYWTIGYGHLLSRDKTADYSHVVWTQAQADAVLEADIQLAAMQAATLPEWPADNVCLQNALTELVFNMGLAKWETFEKCRAALSNGNLSTAAAELMNSTWAKQVGPRRRNRLAGYLRNGAYR